MNMVKISDIGAAIYAFNSKYEITTSTCGCPDLMMDKEYLLKKNKCNIKRIGLEKTIELIDQYLRLETMYRVLINAASGSGYYRLNIPVENDYSTGGEE